MAKILVVDDSPTEIHVLQTILEKNGHEVVVADSGEAGIEKAKETMPDLVLMDLKMPVMNGYEATQEIKKIAPEQIVIAQTAYAQHQDRQNIKEVGFDELLTKPIRPDDAFKCLGRFFA